MTRLQMIANNPYRILGVYAGLPMIIGSRNLSRIRAFAKVGKDIDFPLKGDNALPALHRTQQMAEDAAQKLSLPNDRLNYALFWYSDGCSEWGETLNNAVTAIIQKDYKTAISYYERLISTPSLREGLLEATTFGLLTLPPEELAKRISEIILSCTNDFESLWTSEGAIPTGKIAQNVYACAAPKSLEKKLKEMGSMMYSTADIYELIEEFKEAINSLMPMCKALEEVYGTEDIRYRNIAEDISQKVIEKGTYLIHKIGELIWIQRPKNKNFDGSYKKHLSKMPVGCIKACMDLIRQTDEIVTGTMLNLKIDNRSRRILYQELNNYIVAKNIEYVEDEKIIRRSLTPFYIKRGITIAAWLSLLGCFFVMS